MSTWLRLLPMALLMAPAAAAPSEGTLAVVVDADEGPLPASTVQSVLWHALYERFGHRAVFLDKVDSKAVDRMEGTPITTLLHVAVEWRADSAKVTRDEGDVYVVGGHYPVIDTTEYALDGHALHARYEWRTEGPLSVFHVRGDAPNHFISLPEISLQETASLAIGPLHAPVWTAERDTIQVPIVLAADDDYRAFYGEEAWRVVAGRVVDRANALLADAGLELVVKGTEAWTSPTDEDDLSSLLESLSSRPIRHDRALRVGFTVLPDLAVTWESEMEDVGRAYLPGRNVLVVDQAAYPGHDPAWDVAEEGVAVAHEVLHALGIPHTDKDDMLMSEVKRGSVHRMQPATIELARAAASSRYTHWDSLAALTALSQSAEAHLKDPDLQMDFIADNLVYGAGLPRPGSVEPRQLSALTNVALGRHYLKQAIDDPSNAWQLQQGARAHAESALAQAPAWKEARSLQNQVRAAQHAAKPSSTAPASDKVTPVVRGDGNAPWKRTHTCPTQVRGTCESR